MEKVTYQEETWQTFWPEAERLTKMHWKEVCQDPSRMPLGLDVASYSALFAAGIMQIVTARETFAGTLVGYQISIFRPHMHYCSVLCAFEDTYFLDPAYRKGFVGVKLISESLRLLKARGVKKVFFQSIESKPTHRLWQWLGFIKTHVTYAKWIGD